MTPEPQFRYFTCDCQPRAVWRFRPDGRGEYRDGEDWHLGAPFQTIAYFEDSNGHFYETDASGTALARTCSDCCGTGVVEISNGPYTEPCGCKTEPPDAGSGGEVPANFKRSGSAFCECSGQWVCDYCEHFKPPTPVAGGAGDVPDTWDAIKADHAKVTFWRTGWQRRGDKPKPPFLQTTAEYVVRRWNRANRRMSAIMVRSDKLRELEEHPTEPGESRTARITAIAVKADNEILAGVNGDLALQVTTLERELAAARAEVTDIGVNWLPYQDHPYVSGIRNGQNVWLSRDGSWITEEESDRCSLPASLNLAEMKQTAAGLRALLKKLRDSIEQLGYETGVCCCGGDMNKHTIGDGHSPVDQGAYFMEPILKEVAEAITPAGGGEEGADGIR